MHHLILCPVCSEALNPANQRKSLSCIKGHSFDIAKQGYLNLLLSQHKKSKQPGDTPEMVNARRDFLNAGHYQEIADFVLQEGVKPCVEKNTAAHQEGFHYLDLACGEGYYTLKIDEYLQRALNRPPSAASDKQGPQQVFTSGMDISTPAIKAACRRSKHPQWLVASLARIPLQTHSQDLVSGLFFHFDFEEVHRVLKAGGHFLMVTTGPKHLIELREAIYDQIKPEQIKDFSQLCQPLQHRHRLQHQYQLSLQKPEDISQLLMMTPHTWRCKPEKKEALISRQTLSVTVDVQLDIFQK